MALVTTDSAEVRYTTTDVGHFARRTTQPYRINNVGQLAGGYLKPDGTAHAFLYDLNTSTFTDLLPGAFGAHASDAFQLNDHGQVVGYARDSQPDDNGLPLRAFFIGRRR